MRVLLSECSGLTSREVATRLGELGHHVEGLSSATLCLSRFTRHVRAIHPAPNFGADPLAWLDCANRVAAERRIDLIFPTQEQVAALAARREKLAVPTIVPSFASLRRVQDKASAALTLERLGAPQPWTIVVREAADLARATRLPAFVKQPIGTASSGVRRVASRDELAAAAREMGLGAGELVVQEEAEGPLAMAQAVASRGRLIAHHVNLRLKEGVGGGASLKESMASPEIAALLKDLVGALDWHGALSMDVILSPRGPLIIDVNPRLVEPGNACRAGVDLVAAMLDLVGDREPAEWPPGRPGVRTRQTLLAVLGAAQRGGTRGAVVRESRQAIFARGAYAGATEELTPVRRDPLAALPVAAALAATLLGPSLWRLFHAGAVGAYALTPGAWSDLVAAAAA